MRRLQIAVEENGYSAYEKDVDAYKTYVFSGIDDLKYWLGLVLDKPKEVTESAPVPVREPAKRLPANEGVATDSNPWLSYQTVWTNAPEEHPCKAFRPSRILNWDENKRVTCAGRTRQSGLNCTRGPSCRAIVPLEFIPKSRRVLSDL